MRNKYLIYTLIILFLSVFIRIYYIAQKQGFHIDEMTSKISIINVANDSNELLQKKYLKIKGKTFKDLLFVKPNISISQDIKMLRLANYDISHPPLYFSLLRIVAEFTDNTPQSFIYAGCGLNLIFFIFSFFIMRLILIRLFGDNKLVPIGLALAFLNTGTISMTLLIRPYELQMLGILLVSYVYLIFCDKLKNNDSILNLKDLLTLIFTISFGFLTGYFVIIYIVLLGLVLLLHTGKNIKNFVCLILSVICAICLVYVFTPSFYNFLIGERFNDITQNAYYSKAFILEYFKVLLSFLFYPVVLLIFFISLFFIRRPLKFNGMGIFLLTFLWSIIIEFISPFKILRYIAPCFPLLCLLPVIIFQNIEEKKRNIITFILIAVYCISAFLPLKKESYDSSVIYELKQFYIPYNAQLQNLFIAETELPDTPIPVFIESLVWFQPYFLISRLNDDQIYYLKDKFDFDKYKYNHFYLLTPVYNREKSLSGYDIIIKGNFVTHKLYEVHRK